MKVFGKIVIYTGGKSQQTQNFHGLVRKDLNWRHTQTNVVRNEVKLSWLHTNISHFFSFSLLYVIDCPVFYPCRFHGLTKTTKWMGYWWTILAHYPYLRLLSHQQLWSDSGIWPNLCKIMISVRDRRWVNRAEFLKAGDLSLHNETNYQIFEIVLNYRITGRGWIRRQATSWSPRRRKAPPWIYDYLFSTYTQPNFWFQNAFND